MIGRIAIDEYHDAGKSSDLLEVASKAASVPRGMMAIGISFHGSECVKGTDISFSVMAIARGTFEDFLESCESVATQRKSVLFGFDARRVAGFQTKVFA
ncbi:hypothetical protein RBSWK_01533 [Rhodopirellula baltica SWK14]|uniref:Uncharacterized protein n=1 Tax=Rhodopirellula baltica SWK14 TaxID=993516 RepID=L7CKN3_RHOBT|nr:hypothetical protein RBSWK_01533 [Rhodopirellula baltica SWK14]